MAVETVVNGREERANDHDYDSNIVELVESFGNSVGMTRDGMVGGRKAKADNGADEEGGKAKGVEFVRRADDEVACCRGDGRWSSGVGREERDCSAEEPG